MPNIELHGYTAEDAVNVRKKVREALKTLKDADQIVTTFIPSNVTDLKGTEMPFLRIISSLNELDEVKEHLKPLGEDIEVIVLHEWIPK